MTDTWGPPAAGWPSFCGRCHRRTDDALHTCPVPDVAGRDVARTVTLADIADADATVMPRG